MTWKPDLERTGYVQLQHVSIYKKKSTKKSERPVYKSHIKKIFSFWLLWMIWIEIWNNKHWPAKVKQQQCICISSTTVKLRTKFQCWKCSVELCIKSMLHACHTKYHFWDWKHIIGKNSSHFSTDPLLQTQRNTVTSHFHWYVHCSKFLNIQLNRINIILTVV